MSSLLLHRPRWVQRLRASFGGYFWLPCELCGRYYGGQEWHHENQSIPHPDGPPGAGRSICPWCAEQGRGSD